MKHITFYLDFISPYAYLAFKALPQSLLGLSYSVTYKPVFLGGLLKHYQKRGRLNFRRSALGCTDKCSGWPSNKAWPWTSRHNTPLTP